MTTHTCINCGKEFDGNFCPECGQRVETSPVSLKFLLKSIFTSFDLDHGVIITFSHLFVKPRQVIDHIFRGNTSKYSNPIKYFIVSISLSLFLSFILSELKSDNSKQDPGGIGMYIRKVFILLAILFPNFLYNRKYTNVYGHLMIALYQMGQVTFVSFILLLFALLTLLIGQNGYATLDSLSALSSLLYLFWSSVKMYDLKGKRAILSIVINFVSLALIITLQTIISLDEFRNN